MNQYFSQILVALFGLIKGLAWPATTLLIVRLFRIELLALGPELRALVPRLREAGPTGVKFDPAAQQSTSIAASEVGRLREIPGLARTPEMEVIERRLHEQIGAIDPNLRLDYLVRALAQAQLEIRFEFLYGIIFGSQIDALRELAKHNSVTEKEARDFFRPIGEQYSVIYEKYGFEGWFAFLFMQGLVLTTKGRIKLTDFGRDFLLWLDAKNRRIVKPY